MYKPIVLDDLLRQRFEANVEKGEECWQWLGGIKSDGYGVIRRGQECFKAHRVAYAIAHGSVPEDMQVDHMCHNRGCVNPAHLRLVTNKQNMENMSGPPVSNTSGYRGVHWSNTQQRWFAKVGHHGSVVWAKTFRTLEEAAEAVRLKRLEIYTHNDLDRII